MQELANAILRGDARFAGKMVDALRLGKRRMTRREILAELAPLGVTEEQFEGVMQDADEAESEE